MWEVHGRDCHSSVASTPPSTAVRRYSNDSALECRQQHCLSVAGSVLLLSMRVYVAWLVLAGGGAIHAASCSVILVQKSTDDSDRVRPCTTSADHAILCCRVSI